MRFDKGLEDVKLKLLTHWTKVERTTALHGARMLQEVCVTCDWYMVFSIHSNENISCTVYCELVP